MDPTVSLLARLFKSEPDPREALRPLWHRVVELSREPAFYRDDGVADTVAGRFDMIAAILALLLLRLERDELAQEITLLTELFVADMDAQLRETGVGDLVVGYPAEVWPTVDTWVDSEDMWLRRSAIICQVGAGERTDADRLFRYCSSRAFEKEFFVRKAIGWALRQHARVDPESVARFVTEHRGELSGLSYREATKHIGHLVA